MRDLPWRSNATTPSMRANSVQSRPMPTLSPAWNLVPTWRTRIEPAETRSPANRLTPRILGPESRPLRVEPCPFLCAMALSLDRGDLHRRVVLTMPVPADVVLAAAELEHDELVAAALLDDLAGDLGAGDGRLADRHAAAIARGHQQHLVEHDRRAGIARELLDHHGLAGLDPVLLSTRLDHGVHDKSPQKAFGIADFTDRRAIVKGPRHTRWPARQRPRRLCNRSEVM